MAIWVREDIQVFPKIKHLRLVCQHFQSVSCNRFSLSIVIKSACSNMPIKIWISEDIKAFQNIKRDII